MKTLGRVNSFALSWTDKNKTEKKHSPIDEDVKLFLINYYKPYNAELSEMIGKDLSAWNY